MLLLLVVLGAWVAVVSALVAVVVFFLWCCLVPARPFRPGAGERRQRRYHRHGRY